MSQQQFVDFKNRPRSASPSSFGSGKAPREPIIGYGRPGERWMSYAVIIGGLIAGVLAVIIVATGTFGLVHKDKPVNWDDWPPASVSNTNTGGNNLP